MAQIVKLVLARVYAPATMDFETDYAFLTM